LNNTAYQEAAYAKQPILNDAPPVPAPSMQVNCGPACGPSGPTCGTCAKDSCSCAHWILGVEAVWLSPQQHNLYSSYNISDGVDVRNYYKDAVPSGLFITPRISLGFQGECWGAQIRYWRMNEAKNTYLPNEADWDARDGLIHDGLNYYSAFKAETLDLEVTRLFCWGDTRNMISYGIRYAELNQTAGLWVAQDLDNATFSGSAFSRHSVSGAGLTMGLTGYKPLPCRNFNLFYSLRGSIVWDASTVNLVETRASYMTRNDSAGSVNGALAETDGTLFIGEIQIGAQWNFELVCNRADAFLRVALEYQYWDTDKTGYAASTSFAGNSDYIGRATARTGDSVVDFIGFSIATGFTW
jgi:hypothetical protein